jgi:hypothetical protein
MRIRITESFITASGAVNAGDKFECPDERACELINLGRAVAVGQTPAERMEQPARGRVAEIRSEIANITSAVKDAAKKRPGERR